MHNNFPINTYYRKKQKTYQLKNFIKLGIPEDFCVFDYLLKHTETSADYLSKYPEVVELILKKISLRNVSKTTGVSYGTVSKISTILKYSDSTLQSNPYLLKHADIVNELLKGSTQREVAEKTGASLATVNTVAKITQTDYIQLNRERGKVTAEKWKQKIKNDPLISDFIKEHYNIWAQTIKIGTSDENIIQEYNQYLKTITIPSIFDIDRYNKISESFTEDLIYTIEMDRRIEIQKERGRERVRTKIKENAEYQKLKKIEDDKESKIRQAKWDEEDRIREQEKLNRDKERKENNDNEFKNLLEAGINPWDEEWDELPKEYLDFEHRLDPISYSWYQDQKRILYIRELFPDLKEYAKDNVKEFNLDLIEKLQLRHYVFLFNKISTESYDYLESAKQRGLKISDITIPPSTDMDDTESTLLSKLIWR